MLELHEQQLLGLFGSISRDRAEAGICGGGSIKGALLKALDEKEWLDAWEAAGDMRPF